LTRARTAAAFVVLAVIAGLAAWWAHDRPGDAGNAPAGPVAAAARYVGSERCGDCHAAELAAWRGSQHARAIQRASDTTALGDFDDARFRYGDVTSTFFRRDGHPWVRTDGPDGALGDFQVQYAFGVYPLQQYLLALPGGRLQALSIAWDARPAEAGGQRWFHLYPGERIDAHDELHWTGRQQNWNYMCADCHSTRVQKHYDAATDAYATTFAELTVGCEACHGPGSAHVDWARTHARVPARGLTTALDERRGVAWTRDAATGQPRRSRTRTSQREIEVCAQCHARRAQLAEDYRPGTPFLDAYRPALLGPELYHADGQQRDEVFIWGSWLQSRMHRAGVTCSDCHDPHTQKLRADGNAVCTQCHDPARYDAHAHHRHASGSPGAQCAECHMPRTTYMVIDGRRDHSMRVPRPDQSVTLGVPNACNRCHTGRDAAWAAAAVRTWLGRDARGSEDFAVAFAAADAGDPRARDRLVAIADDANEPAIVRASALERLAGLSLPPGDGVLARAVGDTEALVRFGAAGLAEHVEGPAQAPVRALLSDPVRAVRIEAARVLAGDAAARETGAWQRAADEYVATLQYAADRPESRVALGDFEARRGRLAQAASAYASARQLHPRHAPAWVNAADLLRAQGEDAEAIVLLGQGLQQLPDDASLHHALGLAQVRLQQPAAALESLRQATTLAPDVPRYAYVYAVALHSLGRPADAIHALERAARRWPNDRDVLFALASFQADAGRSADARRAVGALLERYPGDAEARALAATLE
jgi:predicted CXXCH cytochrome family protein